MYFVLPSALPNYMGESVINHAVEEKARLMRVIMQNARILTLLCCI